MVHWVYVLKSSTTGAIYVGETTRLYRRWNEHTTGRGGATTSCDEYDTLIGLYDAGKNWSFLTYGPEMMNNKYNYRLAYYWDSGECDKQQACQVENHITERYRVETKPFWLVKGGKYCRDNRLYDMTSVVRDRPLCKCGYPCEVKLKSDQTKLYFTCPVPSWTEFEGVHVPEPCKFWEEFLPYRTLRDAHRAEYAAKKRREAREAFVDICNELTASDFTTSSQAPV